MMLIKWVIILMIKINLIIFLNNNKVLQIWIKILKEKVIKKL